MSILSFAQGDEEEEETDNLVNQVLDEIGINLDEQMVAAPGQKTQVRECETCICTAACTLCRRAGSKIARSPAPQPYYKYAACAH